MQSELEITIHPVDLSRHGKNPYGKPLYRVVWADSRKSKVLCRGKIHELPRYFHGAEGSAGGHWVLEKWVAPEVLLGMGREQYEALIRGGAAGEEYPEHGDYELSYVFPEFVDETWLHQQLAMHEHRFLAMTDTDRRLEIEAQEDAREQAAEEQFDAVFEQAKETIH